VTKQIIVSFTLLSN